MRSYHSGGLRKQISYKKEFSNIRRRNSRIPAKTFPDRRHFLLQFLQFPRQTSSEGGKFVSLLPNNYISPSQRSRPLTNKPRLRHQYSLCTRRESTRLSGPGSLKNRNFSMTSVRRFCHILFCSGFRLAYNAETLCISNYSKEIKPKTSNSLH